jgi:hypothetical protein
MRFGPAIADAIGRRPEGRPNRLMDFSRRIPGISMSQSFAPTVMFPLLQ